MQMSNEYVSRIYLTHSLTRESVMLQPMQRRIQRAGVCAGNWDWVMQSSIDAKLASSTERGKSVALPVDKIHVHEFMWARMIYIPLSHLQLISCKVPPRTTKCAKTS